jgi:HEAT repeat protein
MTEIDDHFEQPEPEPALEQVLPAVLRLLAVSDHALSVRELRTLARMTSSQHELFWKHWNPIGPERRTDLVRALLEQAEDTVDFDFSQLWIWLLEDKYPNVRAAAVEGLWEQERLSVMRRLLELLATDPAPEVRAAAALALSQFAARAALDELDSGADDLRRGLLTAVTDRNQPVEVHRRALESLGYFCDDQTLALIDAAYGSRDQLLRESALVAMGRSMEERYLPTIAKELGSASPAMRYEAARAAGEFGEDGRPLLAKLIPLVETEDTEVALEAIWALGQIGGPSAQRTLQRISQGRDETRREAAEEALAELGLDELKS